MKKILILLLIFFMFNSSALAYSDNSEFLWAKDAIDKWSSKGYISGYPDGTFRGNNYITRAEVISIINKLNNANIKVDKRAGKDVYEKDWFFHDMGEANTLGLIDVNIDGNLRPREFATREEVMVILSKLFNISYTGNLNNAKVKQFFDSNEISSENYKRVAGIVEEGFVNGYKDNMLKPKGKITRAEFMCILDNAIYDVFSDGEYDNSALVGNIIINGEDISIKNSEIRGRVFVLDGARDRLPIFINTKVSEGINSRVGEILIKNSDEFETLTEYNESELKKPEDVSLARLNYSETDWTNDDVKVTVKINDYESLSGSNKVVFERNGEKEIEYEYNGDIIRLKAKVTNIDKIPPKVTYLVEAGETKADITLNIEDDGLSPIIKISCSNGDVRRIDRVTNEIDKTFTVIANDTYKFVVEDEASNQTLIKVKVSGIRPTQTN